MRLRCSIALLDEDVSVLGGVAARVAIEQRICDVGARVRRHLAGRKTFQSILMVRLVYMGAICCMVLKQLLAIDMNGFSSVCLSLNNGHEHVQGENQRACYTLKVDR